MAIVLFDLDETLLNGDSDYLWGQYLVSMGVVDGEYYERENRRYYQDYRAGHLDIYAFSRFAFKPLADNPIEQLNQWRKQYVQERIRPIVLSAGIAAIREHQHKGDEVIIITSTNRFITTPIAELLGVKHLIAAEPEMKDGRYTGELEKPCFSRHKVTRLQEWLEQHDLPSMENSYAYSDSHNDIPLLESVTNPVAVDPDDSLRMHALQNQWSIVSFRE